MKIKIMIIIVLMSVLIVGLSMAGNWDRIELNDKSFAISIGIDKVEPVLVKDEDVSNENIGFTPPKRYKVTFEFPILKEEGGSTEKNSSSGSSKKNIVSVESESIYTATLKAQEMVKEKIDFSHTKAVLLSENLAKDPKMIKEVMDNFERNTQFSGKVSIMVVKDYSAEEILKTEPNTEPIIGLYINSYYAGTSERISTTVNTKLTEASKIMTNNLGTLLLPEMTKKEDKISISGSAVIKNYSLVGWLDGGETERLYSIKGKVKLTQIAIKYKGDYISEDILDTSRKLKIEYKDGKLIFNIKLSFETELTSQMKASPIKLSDEKVIEEIEIETEKYIKLVKEKAMEKLQKQYDADVTEMYVELKKKDYKLWKQLKDNWDETFKNAIFNMEIDVKIRNVGLVD